MMIAAANSLPSAAVHGLSRGAVASDCLAVGVIRPPPSQRGLPTRIPHLRRTDIPVCPVLQGVSGQTGMSVLLYERRNVGHYRMAA
jgi:hypothetical protein